MDKNKRELIIDQYSKSMDDLYFHAQNKLHSLNVRQSGIVTIGAAVSMFIPLWIIIIFSSYWPAAIIFFLIGLLTTIFLIKRVRKQMQINTDQYLKKLAEIDREYENQKKELT